MRAEFTLVTKNDANVNLSLFEAGGIPMINLRIDGGMDGVTLTQKEALALGSIFNDFGYNRYYETDVLSKENKPD